ncbi:MAG: hypothetical protein U5M51_06955 [Emticicia sp.]|nr:hypothetical protein [Emticicia sp.]
MQITYQLNEDELTYEFFKALKKTLKGKINVEFSIKAEESPYKISKEAFEKKILNSEKSENQYVFVKWMMLYWKNLVTIKSLNPGEAIRNH